VTVRLDLVCPMCTHEAGPVELDAAAHASCPACGEVLAVTHVVTPAKGLAAPPSRQLARRVEPPVKTRVRVHRDGDRLRAHLRFGLLTPFMKRLWLTPDGLSTRTWKRTGRTFPLVQVLGFFVLDHVSSPPGAEQVDVVPSTCYAVSLDGGCGVAPLFGHLRRADAIYMTSVLNQQLEHLRARLDPYRG
jgi:hypothetical protein